MSVYENCPNFESARFQLRLVELSDAWDLLECYSDKNAVKLFNSDNCTSNFYFTNIKDMEDSIKFWLSAYKDRAFIRFSIIDFFTGKAIGTIEIFNKTVENKNSGILRLDLKSEYEKDSYINDLMHLINTEIKDSFSLESIITKAVPTANERLKVLKEHDFSETNAIPYGHYYIKHY